MHCYWDSLRPRNRCHFLVESIRNAVVIFLAGNLGRVLKKATHPPGVLAPNQTRIRSFAALSHFSCILRAPTKDISRFSINPGCMAHFGSPAYFPLSMTIFPKQPRMPLSSTARHSPSNPYRSANYETISPPEKQNHIIQSYSPCFQGSTWYPSLASPRC
jgi:hypothetical protein